MKLWDKLWKREKRWRKTVVCANLKQTPTKYGMALCGVSVGQCWEKYHIYKKCMDEFLIFLSMINRYIAAFCDMKKITKISFIF